MTKQQAIGQIRTRAERDLAISDGALRLLLRLCSHIYVNPKATFEKPFPLPWSTVALWCGLSDDKSAARRIAELVDAHYLKSDGLRGCPPTNHFFLIPNCPSKGAINCPSKGANNYRSRGAINCPSKGAHLISNSFQEERLEEREQNSALRATGNEGQPAASPLRLSKEEVGRRLRDAVKRGG
jgi:hypothetical protein